MFLIWATLGLCPVKSRHLVCFWVGLLGWLKVQINLMFHYCTGSSLFPAKNFCTLCFQPLDCVLLFLCQKYVQPPLEISSTERCLQTLVKSSVKWNKYAEFFQLCHGYFMDFNFSILFLNPQKSTLRCRHKLATELKIWSCQSTRHWYYFYHFFQGQLVLVTAVALG